MKNRLKYLWFLAITLALSLIQHQLVVGIYVVPPESEEFIGPFNLTFNSSTRTYEGSIFIVDSPKFPDGIFRFPYIYPMETYNISKYSYLYINASMIGERGREEYFVGDDFFYEIFIANYDLRTIDDKIVSNFTVTIIDPTGNIVGEPYYFGEISLSGGKFIRLYPFHIRGAMGDISTRKHYKFASIGTYTLEINFNKRSFGKELRYVNIDYSGHQKIYLYDEGPPPYRVYVDVMPAWELETRDLTRKTTELVEDAKILNEEINRTLVDISGMLQQMEGSQKTLNYLTALLVVLTGILAFLTHRLYRIRSKPRRRSKK